MKSSKSATPEINLPEAGTPLQLASSERGDLRSRAHALSPVVWVGQAGISEAVLLEIERALRAHELIKLKWPEVDKSQRMAWGNMICERLSAAPVQWIGRIMVLYRPR